MKTSLHRSVALCVLCMSLATPIMAAPDDPIAPAASSRPTVGIGLSLSFGRGKVDTGVGIRIFSGNKRNATVATAGVDYMLTSQKWRGTLGVARLGSNAYIGLDLGLGLQDGALDFGLGAGGVSTRKPAALPPN